MLNYIRERLYAWPHLARAKPFSYGQWHSGVTYEDAEGNMYTIIGRGHLSIKLTHIGWVGIQELADWCNNYGWHEAIDI